MKNKIIQSSLLLVFFLTGVCGQVLAQIQNPPIDGKVLTPADKEKLGHLVWYKEPWLWLVAALIIVLIIVATRKVSVKNEGEHAAAVHENNYVH